MKRLGCLILCLFLLSTAVAEEFIDGVYPLAEQLVLLPEEELFLTREEAFYSGAPVYKGTTKSLLPGCCVLHSAAMAMSNLLGETVTAQQLAYANNKGYNSAPKWTSIVVWGRLAGAFSVQFDKEDIAELRRRLKARGVKQPERTEVLADTVRTLLETRGDGVGLIAHFNSTGVVNGDGNLHTVVILGYIQTDGILSDFVVSDNNIPSPTGVCVRMTQSTLPRAMLGAKKADSMTQAEVFSALLEKLVTCRWVTADAQ